MKGTVDNINLFTVANGKPTIAIISAIKLNSVYTHGKITSNIFSVNFLHTLGLSKVQIK